MNFELKSLSPQHVAALPVDALVVLCPETVSAPSPKPSGQSKGLSAVLADVQQGGHFEAGIGKALSMYRADGVQAPWLVLVRAGHGSAADVRKAVLAGLGLLKMPGVKKVGVYLGLLAADAAAVRAAVVACSEATYSYTATKPSAKPGAVSHVVLGVPDAAAVRAGFDEGLALATGVELAREWANRPANHATPSRLAEVARKLGRNKGFKTEVLGLKEVSALGMGAFMAVARGSAEPLKFIVMHYNGGSKSSAPVVLVGKGITFDTGGISIKPAAEMDEMKFDMGGAASVLGTFAALAELRPAINVVGLIPTCENMPDGLAVKPGDVVTSMSGQTIEVLNTDAEGRLILCDALTYAARFKPRCVIDIATLTGACVIALGAVRSGLFASQDRLAEALATAGETALDPCWRMPLDDAYADGLKSNFADMGNVAGRAAGAITAAKFLQKFVADMPWAHLDIAGTAWKSGAAKGATGRPVPLLVQFLVDQARAIAEAGPSDQPGASARRAVGQPASKPAKSVQRRRSERQQG